VGSAPEPPELETPGQQDARLWRMMWLFVAQVLLGSLFVLVGIRFLPWLVRDRQMAPGGFAFEVVKYGLIVALLFPWKMGPPPATKEAVRRDIRIAVTAMLLWTLVKFLFVLL
jgi:hypothetical protein